MSISLPLLIWMMFGWQLFIFINLNNEDGLFKWRYFSGLALFGFLWPMFLIANLIWWSFRKIYS